MALDVGFSLLASSVRSHVSPAQSAESWSGFVRLQERTANGWQHVQRIELADFWGTEATAKERLGAILRALEQPSSALSDRILTIPAMRPDGFDVELYIHDTGIDGYFGGLTQEFETLGEAMTWVRRALSNSYRLRTINTSGVASRWQLEPVGQLANSHGGTHGPTLASGQSGLLAMFLAMFKAKTIEYRQNGLDLALLT